jgi:NAD(P)-dependent dehydrogenase (short-subunit alcohol dehydrogenase family)
MAFIFGRGKFVPDRDIPDQSEKVIVVTGGNNGLGKETILQLAKHNPSKIYMGARSEEKAQKAIADIKRMVPRADPKFLLLDVSSFQSIEKATKVFLAENDRLDLLVNNAGIMGVENSLSADGYEIQFATNYLGPALLTKLLLPTLAKTAALPGSDVRIVNVSSTLYDWAPKTGIPYSKLKTKQDGVDMMLLYGESKLAQIYHAQVLAKRYSNITSVSLHPGIVRTDIVNPNAKKTNPYLHWIFSVPGKLVSVDVATGTLNQLWASVADRKQIKNGAFYTPLGKEIAGNAFIDNPKAANELWDWTEKELIAYGPSKL